MLSCQCRGKKKTENKENGEKNSFYLPAGENQIDFSWAVYSFWRKTRQRLNEFEKKLDIFVILMVSWFLSLSCILVLSALSWAQRVCRHRKWQVFSRTLCWRLDLFWIFVEPAVTPFPFADCSFRGQITQHSFYFAIVGVKQTVKLYSQKETGVVSFGTTKGTAKKHNHTVFYSKYIFSSWTDTKHTSYLIFLF